MTMPDREAALEGALRAWVEAHEEWYEPLVERGILGDPQYGEPHIPNRLYIALVDAYEGARALLAEAEAVAAGPVRLLGHGARDER